MPGRIGVTLAAAAALSPPPAADPPQIDSIEPATLVRGTIPQPELVLNGSNFRLYIGQNFNPTVTLRQEGVAEFAAVVDVNLSGTQAFVRPHHMNLVPAPIGVYDVILTRPDGESDTLTGGFEIAGAPEPEGIHLDVLSAWGGTISDLDVVGNLAYVAAGRRLVILDLTDPQHPVEVGSLITGVVLSVAVKDGYALVAIMSPDQLLVVDVGDPSDPVVVGYGTETPSPRHIEFYGNLAYVVDAGGIDILDVTDPLNLVHLNSLSVGDVAAMTIAGDRLYIATDVGGTATELAIYDLASDPIDPPLLALMPACASPLSFGVGSAAIAVESSHIAWTVENDDGSCSLHVVDVATPSEPVCLGSYTGLPDQYLHDVALSGGFAYVAHGADNWAGWADTVGLAVFDVATDPDNPTLVSTVPTHGNVRGVRVFGDSAYLFDDGEGLIIVDVTDPASPVRLGSYHSPASLRQIDKVGDLLYISDPWNGFTILDVSDPTAPQVAGVYLAEHVSGFGIGAWGIDVEQGRAYLAAAQLGLEVVDVADPANPVLLGAFRIPPDVHPDSYFIGVTVSDGVAHVGYHEYIPLETRHYFLNLDVNDPGSIFECGRAQTINGVAPPSTIELNGDGIAFCGRYSHVSFAVAFPQVHVDVGSCRQPRPVQPEVVYEGAQRSAMDVALDGDVLYLADEDDGNFQGPKGIWVQDVSDPGNPVTLALIDAEGFAVATQNQRLYAVARLNQPPGAESTAVFDVANPATPQLLATSPRIGGIRSDIFVDEPYVYVSNGGTALGTGLAILELAGFDPADLDHDGVVGTSDLLALLAGWGPCPDPCPPSCSADVNGDCTVGTADLLVLLASWG